MKRILLMLLVCVPAIGQTVPGTRPAFTISKETTLIEGPVKADGTIDYIPAINALLGANVKNEENAAIPLLLLEAGTVFEGKIQPRTCQLLDMLHAPIPEKVESAAYLLSTFGQRKNTGNGAAVTEEALLKLQDRLIVHPWKAQEQPLAAEWVATWAGNLKLAEEASRRSKFYVPFCVPAEKSITGLDGSAIEAMTLVSIMSPNHMLLTRAQMRAGAGDLAGALSDVRASRNLARVADRAHVELMHLLGVAAEAAALHACAGIAASGTLTRAELAVVRQEIVALPPISDDDPVRLKVEEMLAMDLAMQCIGGKSLEVLRLMAWDLTGKEQLDLSDWKNIEWDVMLRETIRLYEEEDVPGDTFLERSRQWEKKLAGETSGPSFISDLGTEGLDDISKRVEAFLKRRTGESRQDYTRRMTRWLMGGNPSDIRRTLGLHERGRMGRVLALTAVALAEHRLVHRAYPEALDKLVPASEADGFTGKAMLYRREREGFRLWSVGMNLRDDGAKGDDLVVGTPIVP